MGTWAIIAGVVCGTLGFTVIITALIAAARTHRATLILSGSALALPLLIAMQSLLILYALTQGVLR